ncbi:MAG: hypothetical protein PHZ00_05765 [Candidatus Peribacteraceae bacterium]|nr:hypothetical protein [Candidatus Peribacteraceae bacterium]
MQTFRRSYRTRSVQSSDEMRMQSSVVRRLLFLPMMVCCLLIVSPTAAKPLKPKVDLPQTYGEAMFGINEVRENVANVQCGGWSDGTATVQQASGPPACSVNIYCHPIGDAACQGNEGFVYPKQEDGTINVHMCTGNTNAEALLLHELVHVAQSCLEPPGTIVAGTTAASCCAMERAAYAVQCAVLAENGQLQGFSIAECTDAGASASCRGYGLHACDNQSFPNPFGSGNSPAGPPTCAQLKTNPTPRLQSALDALDRLARQTTVTGGIPLPVVTGLPGRTNTPAAALAKAETGMGERGDFDYPPSAYGFVSDCDVTNDCTNCVDNDLRAVGPNGEAANLSVDLLIDPDGRAHIEPGTGIVHVNPHKWCRLDVPEFATPKYCKMLFDAWMYFKDHAPRPDMFDASQGPLSSLFCPVAELALLGIWTPVPLEKTYCFDFTEECRGDECRTISEGNQCNTQKLPANVKSEFTECEVFRDPLGNITGINVTHGGVSPDAPSPSSFYRHYIGSFTNVPPPVPASASVTAPTRTWKLRGDCYGYYREDDPKECVTNAGYDQCELTIASPDEQDPYSPEWPDGEGHAQKETIVGTFSSSPRPPRTVPDPWKADPDSSLILIDTKKLEQIQQGFDDPLDILPILGTPLPVRQVATAATTPDHGFTDMFDDSDVRTVSGFWEAQQKELLTMVQDPQTKLIMPARFLVGLSDDDLLFQFVRGAVSRSNGTVELTIRAGPEDVGNLLTSLMRMYVAPVQEVRIPLIVPLASVAEIDARIFDWEQWKLREDARYAAEAAQGITTNPSRAAEAGPLIQKLNGYKTGIEKVRLLRGALPNYLKKLLTPEQEIRGYVADWYRQNAAILRQAAERSLQRKELKDLWRQIQQAMLVTDECQLLWCSNQRYSLAIFSLLDQWWGAGGTTRNHEYKPRDLRDLHYYPPKDHEFDFSDMKFPREPLLIPVLWPVQARIKLPVPPLVGGKPPDVNDFPDLPWIPDPAIFNSFPVPSVTLPAKETLTAPSMPDLSQAIEILREFRSIVGGGEQTPVYDRASMQGAYCRFTRSVTIPPDPTMLHGKPERIVHVENDLKERTARLFARWMPNRQEDFAGKAARLQKEYPPPMKPKCREDTLCVTLFSEEWREISWQWIAPSLAPDFTSLAKKLEIGASGSPSHGGTLPANESVNPYTATVPQLNMIFEGLPLPTVINLLVPPRASPASSSTP